MKGRVKFTPPGYVEVHINWVELVEKPFKEGRVIEAFASADAIIDSSIGSCLRQIYSDFKCQDLINEIQYLRGRVNFDSIVLLEILKSKTAINEEFVQKVRQFKLARNLVLHNIYGEYALIIGNPKISYSTQEQLDKFVEEESKKWINTACEIFIELTKIVKKIDENKDYYFSGEFYRNNPRGRVTQKKFPRERKKRK